jgi:glycosyltransferase involved in cell wall biosynthesis
MEIDTPTVEIIVPSYNRKAMLSDTIESLLRQSYSNLRVIVIDDGSIDGTFQMLSRLQIKDSRLVVKRNNMNVGESEAVSIGWKLCKERFVAIVNSDDPQDEYWLADMMRAIQKNPGYVLYYPNRKVLGEKNEILRYEKTLSWDRNKIYQNLFCLISVGTIINKSVLPNEMRIRPNKLAYPSDLIQLLEVAKYGEGFHVSNVYGCWREHADNLSNLPKGIVLSERFYNSIFEWFSSNIEYPLNAELKAHIFGHMWKIARKTEIRLEVIKYLISKGLVSECRNLKFCKEIAKLLIKRLRNQIMNIVT